MRKLKANRFILAVNLSFAFILHQVMIPSVAHAQPGAVSGGIPPVAILPSSIKINRRPPVPFIPFPMINPSTRKPAAADETLTLPDGRKVKAGEFYAELNRIEKELNALGYSLRTMPDNVLLQESVIGSQRLGVPNPPASQVRLSRAEIERLVRQPVAASDGQRALMGDELTELAIENVRRRNPQRNVVIDDNTIKILPGTTPQPLTSPPPALKTFHNEKPFGWSYPEGASEFVAYVNGKIQPDGVVYPFSKVAELNQSGTEFQLGAEMRAGGTILGKNFDLVQATAKFRSPADTTKPLNASLKLSVLGATVYNFAKNYYTNLELKDSISRTVNTPEVPFGIPLGPVFVGGHLGAKGTAGFNYGVSLNHTGVSGNVDPFVHTEAYGEGGASIVVGGAGLGVSLTLVKADLNLYGNAALGWLLGWFAVNQIYADYALDMLSGRLYAYVYTYVPCWTGLCKKQWEHNFWKWKGFKFGGTLFEQKQIIPL